MQAIATLLAGLTPAIALSWAIISYRLGKKTGFALERTKFIFENLRFFETDPTMQIANKILYGFTTNFSIDDFIRIVKTKGGSEDEISKCMAVDNYLNFLWRIAYAHLALDTITLDDMDAFGYYFYTISMHSRLMEYCVEEGFEEVIDAIAKLKPVWEATEIENSSRKALIPNLVASVARIERSEIRDLTSI